MLCTQAHFSSTQSIGICSRDADKATQASNEIESANWINTKAAVPGRQCRGGVGHLSGRQRKKGGGFLHLAWSAVVRWVAQLKGGGVTTMTKQSWFPRILISALRALPVLTKAWQQHLSVIAMASSCCFFLFCSSIIFCWIWNLSALLSSRLHKERWKVSLLEVFLTHFTISVKSPKDVRAKT